MATPLGTMRVKLEYKLGKMWHLIGLGGYLLLMLFVYLIIGSTLRVLICLLYPDCCIISIGLLTLLVILVLILLCYLLLMVMLIMFILTPIILSLLYIPLILVCL